jgi:Tol biopolymer transport system component
MDIYVMDADGSNVVRRTAGPHHAQPSWSPDGKQIAFERNGNLFVMSADDEGTEPRLVTGGGGSRHGAPAWSPDGSKLAYAREDIWDGFASDIYVTTLDGSSITQATNGMGTGSSLVQYHEPAWSPDGRRIAVLRCPLLGDPCALGTSLALMNADGSEFTLLAATAGYAVPTWSPDGRSIAFSAWNSIHWISADGSERGVIVTHGHSPAWRPAPPPSP